MSHSEKREGQKNAYLNMKASIGIGLPGASNQMQVPFFPRDHRNNKSANDGSVVNGSNVETVNLTIKKSANIADLRHH